MPRKMESAEVQIRGNDAPAGQSGAWVPCPTHCPATRAKSAGQDPGGLSRRVRVAGNARVDL